jgi:hypothetical protein
MDFNQLMSRMRELDSSAESPAVEENCGAMSPSMPVSQPEQQQTPPPSMTVNLNAHGMSDIESMMKLFQKVNPDMMPKDPAPMPSISAPPSIMSITPDAGPKPINKLLPDLSDEPEGPTPDAMKQDSDMDDMDDEEDKKEDSYANEPDETEYEIDKVVFGGNDLHKEKKTYPKVAGGDNPMQKTESGDLRAQIRAELLQRLAEAKSK